MKLDWCLYKKLRTYVSDPNTRKSSFTVVSKYFFLDLQLYGSAVHRLVVQLGIYRAFLYIDLQQNLGLYCTGGRYGATK